MQREDTDRRNGRLALLDLPQPVAQQDALTPRRCGWHPPRCRPALNRPAPSPAWWKSWPPPAPRRHPCHPGPCHPLGPGRRAPAAAGPPAWSCLVIGVGAEDREWPGGGCGAGQEHVPCWHFRSSRTHQPCFSVFYFLPPDVVDGAARHVGQRQQRERVLQLGRHLRRGQLCRVFQSDAECRVGSRGWQPALPMTRPA